MAPRRWKDPNGRTWKLSLLDPSNPALAISHKWPPRNPAHLQIRFRDPDKPTHWGSVPYHSDKSLSQLSDEEIAGYWEKLVAAHPEFATPPTPELPPGL